MRPANVQAVSFVTPAEREIYRDYERERRMRLARIIGGAFSALLAFALLAQAGTYVFQPRFARPINVLTTLALTLCLALYLFGAWQAGKGRDVLAASAIVISTLLVITAFQVTWTHDQGVDPLAIAVFGGYLTTIALAGILGTRGLLYSVTILTNALTVLLCVVLPRPMDSSYFSPEAFITVVTIVSEQWAVAVLVAAAASGYLRSLRELGDVRVAYERAKKLDELKDQFISSVNHELRNPIMALYNYVDILRLSGTRMAEEKRQSLLAQAAQVGDRVLDLLKSILDVRRLDQGAADFTPTTVDVRQALETAAQLLDPREGNMIERDLRVRIAPGIAIWGDAVRLQQILTNLLSNAVKYSQPGSPVEVTAEIVSETEQVRRRRWRSSLLERPVVEITVSDYGLGIPPDQIPLLFQRFVRLPRDLASKTIGNGLGLHLCRVLAEAMGGRIWVESNGIPDEGSTFYLHLPLPPAPSPETPQNTGDTASAATAG